MPAGSWLVISVVLSLPHLPPVPGAMGWRCVSPRVHRLKPQSPKTWCSEVEVRGPEGGELLHRISACLRRGLRPAFSFSLSLPHEDTARRCHLQTREEQPSPDTICQPLNFGLPSLQDCGVSVGYLRHSCRACLLRQLDMTKTLSKKGAEAALEPRVVVCTCHPSYFRGRGRRMASLSAAWAT